MLFRSCALMQLRPCGRGPVVWNPLAPAPYSGSAAPRWAGAKGFQTTGPRPQGLNCINAQSRVAALPVPENNRVLFSRPVFPQLLLPFISASFPGVRGSFPGDRHVLSNLLASSLVSLVLCIPFSPLWFEPHPVFLSSPDFRLCG